jgi:hypothetical protein
MTAQEQGTTGVGGRRYEHGALRPNTEGPSRDGSWCPLRHQREACVVGDVLL